MHPDVKAVNVAQVVVAEEVRTRRAYDPIGVEFGATGVRPQMTTIGCDYCYETYLVVGHFPRVRGCLNSVM